MTDIGDKMASVRWAFRCGCWTPSSSEWLFAARCVQQEEKDRIGKFVFAKDAKSAMAGRLLLRRFVCERMHIPWAQFRLERSPRGKPYLAAPPEVRSSTVPEFFRIMTRQFTPHEWHAILSAGSEQRQLATFYRHWALKESFIKAIGTGLGFNLQRAEFHLSSEVPTQTSVICRTRMHLDEEEDHDWVFEESLLDEDHHVAVALGPMKMPSSARPTWYVPAPAFTQLSFSDLMASASPLTEEDPAYWESFRAKAEAPLRPRLARIQS
ncbi:L-aminoadipate-semialdehyde dehydrogenase-phosphopantetheinyl transferase-like isoform X2 [Nerophis ophidion]|uniref:L-aminoadipate-semialdehyde dehydrogenase-phosphopantetheinyl transferase-like isoform X2 n=1 Tax=Nerophis ophidion TaxID=159077 RepID=UPI002ADFD032|nr:L-aminoadipate-semialdehyde dehydrogenase-phosphopantetheinyl transferase-like isoform X2 [Nerophis ophidion]